MANPRRTSLSSSTTVLLATAILTMTMIPPINTVVMDVTDLMAWKDLIITTFTVH